MQIFELSKAAAAARIPIPRLTNWTVGRPYTIRPSVRAATGKGSRNLFDLEDIYLIALVNRLSEGGLSSRVIQGVLDRLQAHQRASLRHYSGLVIEVKEAQVVNLQCFVGSEGGELFRTYKPSSTLGWYSVDLLELWKQVDQRIAKLSMGRKRGKGNG